jgi:cyclin C
MTKLTIDDFHYDLVLQFLGKHIKVRQQVIATSITYFKRFYLRNAFCLCDPLLASPTCLYLATKIEECIVPLKVILRKMELVVQHFNILRGFPYKTEDITECEFYLLEEFNYSLIVYHPYRPLIQYMFDAGLKHYLQFAWLVLNDSYRTNICLFYPPYIVALATIYIIYVSYEHEIMTIDLRTWFLCLNVNMEEIIQVVKIILEMYKTSTHYQPSNAELILEKLTLSLQKNINLTKTKSSQ